VALVFYFVTSSDSGSFVIDIISANGHPDPPVAQRVFWSITEGATACALLAAGRNLPNSQGALKALQSCSMVAGLPYTFVLFWCSQSLFLLCREESGEISKDRKQFNTFIMSFARGPSVLKNTFVPGLTMGRVVRVVGGWPMHALSPTFAGAVWSALFQLLYVLPIILVILAVVLYQWCIVGLALYTGFAAFLGILRTSVRNKYGIQHGDLLTDFICSFFMPMFTLAQMEEQIEIDAQVDVMVVNEPKEAVDNQEKEIQEKENDAEVDL
jgi:Cys-rich protein (TIGR01571 family)